MKNWSKVKLRCAFFSRGPNRLEYCKSWCAWLYIKQAFKSMIKFSVSILWSKVKLHHLVSLRFGLKEGKIALNITKIGMHSYLQNGHLNLLSNFNSEKLVKSETSSCYFAMVWLKWGEISSKHHEIWRACLPMKWKSKSMIKFNSEKLIKSETPSCGFASVELKVNS